jgi:hypothetical protein
MSIEGQMGSLDPARVRRILRDAERAAACYTRRVEALPCLAGHVALRIRVGEDGAVRWAIPTESTWATAATERCMVETAATLRFEAPCGGEAEVAYALDLDGGPDRPATDVAPGSGWRPPSAPGAPPSPPAATVTIRALQVTLYVAPDGTVAAAGAALASHEATGMTDCVLREVQALAPPDARIVVRAHHGDDPVAERAMDFELNETQAMVRETARAFSDRVLRPRAAEFERAERIPSEVLKEMAELGLMGVNVPAALGGAEAGAVSYACAMRRSPGGARRPR